MTQYHAVIGNREYIKINGDRRPFWEFLDSQPDGWLCSLTYCRNMVLPPDSRPFIFDCGAWSYRTEDVPPITPSSALEQYREHAPEHAALIAPDHMLIKGCNVDARTRYNLDSAEKFLRLCTDHVPMATVHGMDVDARIESAKHLVQMGYRHLALGGMAARAAQKKLMIETVRQVREAVPSVRLHVLGLSSPEYMQAFHRLHVDSVDGSSHFKQAFTAGTFYEQSGTRLIKHKAGRETVPDTIPPCDCRACNTMRSQGIDTRTYGSNENNMGRAAHNANMLMRAHQEIMQPRVALIACCGSKRDQVTPAKDLYTSALFRKSRRWAERHCDDYYILSAKYGLLDKDQCIAPYDCTLNQMTAQERRQWSAEVQTQIETRLPNCDLTVLAGKKYSDWTVTQYTEKPLAGLGIGQQLQWLNNWENCDENRTGSVRRNGQRNFAF